jgi:hypothetical protein
MDHSSKTAHAHQHMLAASVVPDAGSCILHSQHVTAAISNMDLHAGCKSAVVGTSLTAGTETQPVQAPESLDWQSTLPTPSPLNPPSHPPRLHSAYLLLLSAAVLHGHIVADAAVQDDGLRAACVGDETKAMM